MNADDAERKGMATGDLVRVTTRIGHFVARVWATQGIRPGVVALSHHMGRWRLHDNDGSRWVTGKVDITQPAPGRWRLRYADGVRRPSPAATRTPRASTGRDPGVHQNLAFPVQPDPMSGMHCWLQKVVVTRRPPDDRYGDVEVDTAKSREVFHEWLALTRPGPNAEGWRRPEFMMRPVKPRRKAFRVTPGEPVEQA